LNHFPDRLFLRLALIAALTASFALVACGRKGPLDPPPASSLNGAPANGQPAAPGAPDKRIPLDILLN